MGQVIAFDVNWRHAPGVLLKALNAVLPEDVSIWDMMLADEAFHPRFSARSRRYEYNVVLTDVRNPLAARYAWLVRQPIDVTRMNQAAQSLLGEHDFAAFGTAPQGEVTVRFVTRALWHQVWDRWTTLVFEIEANAFLFRMVRRIVKMLVRVGQGQLSVDDVTSILASRDIRRVKGLAPACGLCLVNVSY